MRDKPTEPAVSDDATEAILVAVGVDALVALRVLDARYAVDHLGGRMRLAA